MRIFISGGLGYVGGRLTQHLAATTKHELIIGTRRAAYSVPWAKEARVIRVDWSVDSLVQACTGIDAVVHLAAMNADACARDPTAALEFNGLGTARLAHAAARQGVSQFIYVSTAHVYGTALAGAVDENTCPQPYHPYATSHRAAEDVVKTVHRRDGMHAVVIRLSNAFGAPTDPAADCWSLLANDLALHAVRDGQIVLSTSGRQRRDFIPMSEACRAVGHLIDLQGDLSADRVVNVGSGWAPTVLEMAQLIAERIELTLGSRPQIITGRSVDSVGAVALEYSVERLRATGFAIHAEATENEIDNLIRFCSTRSGAIRS